MRVIRRLAIVLAMLGGLCPSIALGQATRAGVVTAVEGHVTATRTASAQPVVLAFKDDVFPRDRITTGDRALARMLLGQQAVLTIRERSTVTAR